MVVKSMIMIPKKNCSSEEGTTQRKTGGPDRGPRKRRGKPIKWIGSQLVAGRSRRAEKTYPRDAF